MKEKITVIIVRHEQRGESNTSQVDVVGENIPRHAWKHLAEKALSELGIYISINQR